MYIQIYNYCICVVDLLRDLNVSYRITKFEISYSRGVPHNYEIYYYTPYHVLSVKYISIYINITKAICMFIYYISHISLVILLQCILSHEYVKLLLLSKGRPHNTQQADIQVY